MIGLDLLIPTRYQVILAHICVAASLIWEVSEASMKACFAKPEDSAVQKMYNSVIRNLWSNIYCCIIELISFAVLGVDSKSKTTSVISIMMHGIACMFLDTATRRCQLGYNWLVFFCCYVPCLIDILKSLRRVLARFRW